MCNIREITIPKFSINVDSLPSGENRFSLDMNANIMIPRDVANNECIAEITISYDTEDGNNILSAVIRGNVMDVDSSLGETEKCSLIRAEALPTIYSRLRSFIGDVLERAHIDLPSIPPVENVTL